MSNLDPKKVWSYDERVLACARIAKLEAAQRWIPVSERLPEAERKEFCPNCEAETPCTHEAELFVCAICGEDFAKYIVSRNCNVSDVSMTQDVLTDVKTPRSIENTNPDYYKDELDFDSMPIEKINQYLQEHARCALNCRLYFLQTLTMETNQL